MGEGQVLITSLYGGHMKTKGTLTCVQTDMYVRVV